MFAQDFCIIQIEYLIFISGFAELGLDRRDRTGMQNRQHPLLEHPRPEHLKILPAKRLLFFFRRNVLAPFQWLDPILAFDIRINE